MQGRPSRSKFGRQAAGRMKASLNRPVKSGARQMGHRKRGTRGVKKKETCWRAWCHDGRDHRDSERFRI